MSGRPDEAEQPETTGGPALPTPCPICRRPARLAFRPFCSQRCADIDLGRWLGERYAIPVDEPENASDGGGQP